jgi:3-oxoacyl-[acyl-carrier-protein] synthase II
MILISSIVVLALVHFVDGFRSKASVGNFLNLHTLRMNKEETIVVTGLGVISSSGSTVNKFYDNVFNGKSGISKIDRFDASRFKCKIGGQIRDFEAKQYFKSKKRVKQNDLSCQYAVAASHLALEDANFNIDNTDASKVGVIIGSAFGGMGSFEDAVNTLNSKGPGEIDPYTVPMILGNTPAGVVAMETGAKGPNFGVQTACATATHALGEV